MLVLEHAARGDLYNLHANVDRQLNEDQARQVRERACDRGQGHGDSLKSPRTVPSGHVIVSLRRPFVYRIHSRTQQAPNHSTHPHTGCAGASAGRSGLPALQGRVPPRHQGACGRQEVCGACSRRDNLACGQSGSLTVACALCVCTTASWIAAWTRNFTHAGLDATSSPAIISPPPATYLDVQPENILFTADWCLRVADFGVAINLNDERAVTRAGTADYMVGNS